MCPDGIVRPVPILASISESVVNETSHLVRTGGLPMIFVLMAVGSACIPVPSEVVMLFAGFAVADKTGSGAHHHLTMIGVVLAGLIGTLVGSWVAYAVGRGGRLELLERHGGKVHMGPGQIQRADRWFQRYGQRIVLFGRLVPVIRAFVSLPAGVARMPVGRFTVLTLIGSLPWVLGLALVGHAVGGEWTSVRKAFEYVDYVLLALIVLGIAYLVVRRRRDPATPAEPPEGAPGAGPAADAP
jgi:membrane protein DedA with SNARE-associated domain